MSNMRTELKCKENLRLGILVPSLYGNDMKQADVRLVASGGRSFLAHKCVLSVSPLLKSLLSCLEVRTSPESVLLLPDFSPACVGAFLQLVYSGRVQLNRQHKRELKKFFKSLRWNPLIFVDEENLDVEENSVKSEQKSYSIASTSMEPQEIAPSIETPKEAGHQADAGHLSPVAGQSSPQRLHVMNEVNFKEDEMRRVSPDDRLPPADSADQSVLETITNRSMPSISVSESRTGLTESRLALPSTIPAGKNEKARIPVPDEVENEDGVRLPLTENSRSIDLTVGGSLSAANSRRALGPTATKAKITDTDSSDTSDSVAEIGRVRVKPIGGMSLQASLVAKGTGESLKSASECSGRDPVTSSPIPNDRSLKQLSVFTGTDPKSVESDFSSARRSPVLDNYDERVFRIPHLSLEAHQSDICGSESGALTRAPEVCAEVAFPPVLNVAGKNLEPDGLELEPDVETGSSEVVELKQEELECVEEERLVKVPEYSCDMCSLGYDTAGELAEHKRTQHLVDNISDDETPESISDFLSVLNKNYESRSERQLAPKNTEPEPSDVQEQQTVGRLSRAHSVEDGGGGFRMPENFDIPQDYIQQIVPKRTPDLYPTLEDSNSSHSNSSSSSYHIHEVATTSDIEQINYYAWDRSSKASKQAAGRWGAGLAHPKRDRRARDYMSQLFGDSDCDSPGGGKLPRSSGQSTDYTTEPRPKSAALPPVPPPAGSPHHSSDESRTPTPSAPNLKEELEEKKERIKKKLKLSDSEKEDNWPEIRERKKKKKKKREQQEGRVSPLKKAVTATPHKATKEAFKPAAPFKFSDDFDWLVPDDYEDSPSDADRRQKKKKKKQQRQEPEQRQLAADDGSSGDQEGDFRLKRLTERKERKGGDVLAWMSRRPAVSVRVYLEGKDRILDKAMYKMKLLAAEDSDSSADEEGRLRADSKRIRSSSDSEPKPKTTSLHSSQARPSSDSSSRKRKTHKKKHKHSGRERPLPSSSEDEAPRKEPPMRSISHQPERPAEKKPRIERSLSTSLGIAYTYGLSNDSKPATGQPMRIPKINKIRPESDA